MANECKVYEQRAPRDVNAPIMTVPFLAKQSLSTTGTSAAFNKSTTMVSIVSTLAGTVEFSSVTADPSGAGDTFPINANETYHFSVRGGTKVRFV